MIPPAPGPTKSRGRLHRHPTHDVITLHIPLTASGHIDDDDATTLLTILLTYSPHLTNPTRFRSLLAAALINAHQDPTP